MSAPVAVTGGAFFLRRHRGLVAALERELPVTTLAVDAVGAERLVEAAELARYLGRAVLASSLPLARRTRLRALRGGFETSPRAFALRSARLGARLRALRPEPRAVVHVFGLASPAGLGPIPYAHYLDYTYALSLRNPWAGVAPLGRADSRAWLELERRSYAGAGRLFAMSAVVRASLLEDYGVAPERVTVVGSGGNVVPPDAPRAGFGSHGLLFNASDFERKGGPLVLEAFEALRSRDARATLTTVGRALPRRYRGRVGVRDLGAIDRSRLCELFAESDLVVAPSRCDPFPGFAIEAMGAGVPCVVAPHDGMPEIVTDCVDGVVLRRETPAELARTLERLLGDPGTLERMSAAARASAATRHTWDAVAAAMLPWLLRPY